MGEPAVPDEKARREAWELARRVLENIEDDASATNVIASARWLSTHSQECIVDGAELERVLWLLASTLVFAREEGPQAGEYDCLALPAAT